MLEHKTTQNPEAIETHVCKPFEKLEMHEMDVETFMMLAQLLMIPKNATFSQISDEDKPFLLQLIEKRIPVCYTFKVEDERLILFLAALAESPGIAVMYLVYIQYWCKKHNVKEIDLDIFCKRIFPHGFPANKDLHELWVRTKLKKDPDGSHGSDNLVDYQSAMKSIQFITETSQADCAQ